MAKKPLKTPAEVVDANRVASIAEQIRVACNGLGGELQEVEDNKLAKAKTDEKVISKREIIMGAVAELSLTDSWTLGEIKAAAKKAAADYNDPLTKSSMSGFIGQCKRAAMPTVRAHYKSLVAIRDLAWDAEVAAVAKDPNMPTPLAQAFKRKFHALIGAMQAANDGEVFASPEHMVKYALAHDPDENPARAHKRMLGLRDQLGEIEKEFPVGLFREVNRILSNITKEQLILAKAAVKAAQDEEEDEIPVPAPDARKLAQALSPKVSAPVVDVLGVILGEPKVNPLDQIDDLTNDNLSALSAAAD